MTIDGYVTREWRVDEGSYQPSGTGWNIVSIVSPGIDVSPGETSSEDLHWYTDWTLRFPASQLSTNIWSETEESLTATITTTKVSLPRSFAGGGGLELDPVRVAAMVCTVSAIKGTLYPQALSKECN
jgi:hypothetical protein